MDNGDSALGQKPTKLDQATLESWSQGFMVGALIIMTAITVANMRSGVLLHKLILIELLLAVPNGFFTFFMPPFWGWYLSSTAVPLIISWNLHNVIGWLKNKPLLGPKGSYFYIGTIILVQPYWIFEIYANFCYFNTNNKTAFRYSRPFEAPLRDPWWIFTTANLFYNIRSRYELRFVDIIRASPRFGVLLSSMLLSLIFIIVDFLSVTPAVSIGFINPFWKLAFVFKCLTDTIILDDFKTALDKLSSLRRSQILDLEARIDNLPDNGDDPYPMKAPGAWTTHVEKSAAGEMDDANGSTQAPSSVKCPPKAWFKSVKRA